MAFNYDPFWNTMKERGENWYTFEKVHHFSSSTLSKLKNNKMVSGKTLNDICRILKCNIEDVVRYVESDDDQPL